LWEGGRSVEKMRGQKGLRRRQELVCAGPLRSLRLLGRGLVDFLIGRTAEPGERLSTLREAVPRDLSARCSNQGASGEKSRISGVKV
jgi:hypothetical protein